MNPFRQRLRETLGIFDSELEEEGGGAAGAAGGAAGGTSSGTGTSTGGSTTAGDTGSDSTSDGDTNNVDDPSDTPDNTHRPFGLGAYWKAGIGNCPKGTHYDPKTGTCKKN